MQLCTLYLVYLYLNVAVTVSSIVCLVQFFPVNHCSKVPFFGNLSFPPFKGVHHVKQNVVLQYAILFNVSMYYMGDCYFFYLASKFMFDVETNARSMPSRCPPEDGQNSVKLVA